MTNKYNARRTEIDGIKFDSQREAVRYWELKLLVQAGEITNLTVHPRYELYPAAKASDGSSLRKVTYVGDFEYINSEGETVCEDVKGVMTPVFRLKRNLFLRLYPHLRFRMVR